MEACTRLHWYRPSCERARVNASFQSPRMEDLATLLDSCAEGNQTYCTEGGNTKVQTKCSLIIECGHRETLQTTSLHCYPSSPLESCYFCKTASPGRTLGNLVFFSKTFAKMLKRCLGAMNVRTTSTLCHTFPQLLKCGDPYGRNVTSLQSIFVSPTHKSTLWV